MFSLRDKVVIVTGVAQGIGRAYALCLAQNGAKVVVSDINSEKGNSVVKEIRSLGGMAIFVPTNVSLETNTRQLAEETVNNFGRIDILINNASIFSSIKMKPFLEITEQEWDELIAVNLKGVFSVVKQLFLI